MTVAMAYELFGLEENAPLQMVKKMRNRLVHKYHPDRHVDKHYRAKYEVISKNINRAYDVIKENHGWQQRSSSSVIQENPQNALYIKMVKTSGFIRGPTNAVDALTAIKLNIAGSSSSIFKNYPSAD